MPINQIPFSNLHKNFTISGTTNANARVMLFNPNENRYVKAVDADANGNYNFGNINSSVPLQIKLASSNYFNCIKTSEIVEPAVSFNTMRGKVIRGIQSVFQLNQNYIWGSTPKIVFSDANGEGSGASAFFIMAGQGELALTGFGSGTPVPLELGTGPDGTPWYGPGYVLKSYTMTSFGSNYTSPKCFIVGNRLTWEQDLSQPGVVYIIVSTAVSVEMSLISPIGIAGDLIDENNFLTSVGITWGQSNTWGNFSNSNNTGNRLLAQIPGYSNINYNASCNTADNTQPGPVLQEKIVEIMAATKNPLSDAVWNSAEYQLYLAIIHGFDYIYGDYVTTGYPRSWDNTVQNSNWSNSAFTTQLNGSISAAELEYLKGWLAQSVQVNAMVNKLNSDFLIWKTNNTAILTSTGYINTGLNVLFGLAGETLHQLGDTIKRYNDANAHASWNIADEIIYDDGTTTITKTNGKSLSQVFWQEWQQSRLRVPALIDAATGDTKTIQKILTKMGNANGSNYLTGIKTNDSTGTYRWDFSGNTLQKIQIN